MPGLTPIKIWADCSPPYLVLSNEMQCNMVQAMYTQNPALQPLPQAFFFSKVGVEAESRASWCWSSPDNLQQKTSPRFSTAVTCPGTLWTKESWSGCRRAAAAAARIWAGEGEHSGSLANKLMTNGLRQPCWDCSVYDLNQRHLEKKTSRSRWVWLGNYPRYIQAQHCASIASLFS